MGERWTTLVNKQRVKKDEQINEGQRCRILSVLLGMEDRMLDLECENVRYTE